jgi:hypothetical protein
MKSYMFRTVPLSGTSRISYQNKFVKLVHLVGFIIKKSMEYTHNLAVILYTKVAEAFSVASDSSMCLGIDSASKNEYQVNPGSKDDRCVGLTTYHLRVPMSRNLGALSSWKPVGLFRPVMGQLLLYTKTCRTMKREEGHVENLRP